MSTDTTETVPWLALVLTAEPQSVGEARRLVRRFAATHGAEGEALAAIELAVSEAAANVVVHAYDRGATGALRVEADIEQGEFELVVADDGRGFSREPAPGLGLGLGLILRCAQALEIRDRPMGGTEVWARFALPAP
jgi:anti-sigma regulatory factor (Ser/Thr protein kinase)